MKKHITGLLAFVFALLLISCEEAPIPTHLTIRNKTDRNIICGYYIGQFGNFVISADYIINSTPHTIYFVEKGSTQSIDCTITNDGKDSERTYQFIFFDGETLDKYTLAEIAERNLYDDIQIYSFDQLHGADFTVTYSGPKKLK